MGRSRIVQYISWWVALLLVGVGLAVATAIPGGDGTLAPGGDATVERGVYVGIALVLAAIVLLVTHQRWGRMAVASAALLLASFAVPLRVAHTVPDTSGCRPPGPCDPAMTPWHPGILLALFVIFFTAALACAAIGFVRERA
jgi:hypothetical protein